MDQEFATSRPLIEPQNAVEEHESDPQSPDDGPDSALSALGRAALEYARRGWNIFLVAPIGEGVGNADGKTPYPGSQGHKDATDDPEQIRQWWTEHPDANIGLNAKASGLVVVDVDTYKEPKDWERFKTEHDLPETYHQSTPGGGQHYIFRAEDGARYPGKLGGLPGEIKHDGYILLAPSRAISRGAGDLEGSYEVIDDSAPAPAPDWLSAPTRSDRDARRADRPDRRSVLHHPSRALIDLIDSRKNTISDREEWLRVGHGMHHEYAETPLEDDAIDAFVEWSIAWQGEGRRTSHTDDKLRKDAEYLWEKAKLDRPDPVTGRTTRMILERCPQIIVEPDTYQLLPHRTKPLAQHKPLPWLYDRHYLRGALSVTVAPGGSGKSFLAIHEALSIAAGKSLLGGKIYRPKRVWYLNGGEDGAEVVAARVDAAMHHHGLTERDLDGRFFCADGPDFAERLGIRDLKFAHATREGFARDDNLIDHVIKFLVFNQIDVLILDPLKHFHLVPENDNDMMNELAMIFVHIAREANCAVEVVHHATKEARQRSRALGIAQARGASALIDKARSGRFLAFMTDEFAEEQGIDDRLRYVEVTSDKSNNGPTSKTGRWFKIESVELGNGTADYPDGDSVGVLVQWRPKEKDPTADMARYGSALKALLEVSDGRRWSDKSPGWLGYELARKMSLDIGEGRNQKERSNAQEAERKSLDGLLRDFEQTGLVALSDERQRNGNTSQVVRINRAAVEERLKKFDPSNGLSFGHRSP